MTARRCRRRPGSCSKRQIAFTPHRDDPPHTGKPQTVAIAAAVAGLGIVMAPLVACRREVESGELIRLLAEWDAGTVELNSVYAGGRAAKPSARAFVDYLIAELRENQPPPDGPAIDEKR